MKKVLILLTVLFSVFLFTKEAQAKTLPQAAKEGKQTAVVKNSVNAGISVSPKLRADRRALIVNFGSLQNASSVSYALTYKTSQQEEGAIGTLNLNKASSQTSELLFGTCSKNVCRYHTGISNMRLEVSYTSKSGKKYLKKFRIKV